MVQIYWESTDLLSCHLPRTAELPHPLAQVSNLAILLHQGLLMVIQQLGDEHDILKWQLKLDGT